MRSCSWTEARSFEYLDNELDQDERSAFEAHLHGCEQCQKVVSEARRVRGLLHDIRPELSSPPEQIQACVDTALETAFLRQVQEDPPDEHGVFTLIWRTLFGKLALCAFPPAAVLVTAVVVSTITDARAARTELVSAKSVALAQLREKFVRAVEHLETGRVRVAFEILDSAESDARGLFSSIPETQIAQTGTHGKLTLNGLPADAVVTLERIAFCSFLPDEQGRVEERALETIELRAPFSSPLRYGCYRVSAAATGFDALTEHSYIFILPKNSNDYYETYHDRELTFHLAPSGGRPTDMVVVPAGDFIAGSNHFQLDETPRHIRYVDTFYIDRTEVPVGSFLSQLPGRALEATSSEAAPVFAMHNMPVHRASWAGANEYARSVGRRLPTEIEWEKAAAGPRGLVWPWGMHTDSDSVANHVVIDRLNGAKTQAARRALPASLRSAIERVFYSTDVAAPRDFEHPLPVTTTVLLGTQAHPVATPYGAIHMHGNVWEWVNGAYEPYPNSIAGTWNGTNDTERLRVRRGGSYNNPADHARAQNRAADNQEEQWEMTGFRCAKSVR